MSKSIKPEVFNAVSDIQLDDVVEVVKRIGKIIGDWRK